MTKTIVRDNRVYYDYSDDDGNDDSVDDSDDHDDGDVDDDSDELMTIGSCREDHLQRCIR